MGLDIDLRWYPAARDRARMSKVDVNLIEGDMRKSVGESNAVYVSVTVLSPGATPTLFGAVAGQMNITVQRMPLMEPRTVATTGISQCCAAKRAALQEFLISLWFSPIA